MAGILDEVLKYIEDKTLISDSVFEGANIVLYTKDKDFFLDNKGTIISIVNAIKKRIELRADPSITMDIEKAREAIEKIVPKDAGCSNIIFDPQRSRVIIEVEKPGLAIGKQGELLKEIKAQTLWVPLINRTPAIRSRLIENIRAVLYENSEFRRKFLNNIGKRIYGGWTKEKRNEWVRISFLGASREVGRSCYLMQTSESKVLLECGINAAAPDAYAFPYLDIPEFNIHELDAVILSHAHLDHSALIPYLYKMGYEGPVYTTAPTRDIAALLALDYIGISQKEAKNPIYSSTDVKNMVKHTICLNYEEVTDITPDIRMTFYNAGHTLGSSQVHLNIGNGLHNFLFTGDMNFEVSNLLNRADATFPRLETLMIESTYGGRDNNPPTRKECEDELIKVVNETLDRKGKVLMPVLGVGRAQEIMIIVERAIRTGLIKDIPVFVQGMVWDVTAIHTTYPDFFNNIVKRSIFHKDMNPFLSKIFRHIASQKEMKYVIEESGPCIIIATSGMMTGGASTEYFKHLADNPLNSLILTSYQGEGSLGRRIQNGDKEITFNGDRRDVVSVKLSVHVFHGFTGHSSRKQLMQYIHRLQPRPKKVITVHGESSKCVDLASSIYKQYRIETVAPRNLDVIRLA
jgi:uncharacterized protein